jgi:hypothetical protein
LAAGNAEIARILIEAKRLTATTLPRLGDEAGAPRHLEIVEIANAHLVIRRQKLKVVLTQATASARAKVDVANKSIAQARILMLLASMADTPL